MVNEKQYDIFNMLTERTAAGQLSWQSTFDDEIFATDMKGYTIQIGPVDPFSGSASYLISIINNSGKRLETFTDFDLQTGQGDFSKVPAMDYRGAFRDLYEAVRRQALNVDGALDDILSDWQKRS